MIGVVIGALISSARLRASGEAAEAGVSSLRGGRRQVVAAGVFLSFAIGAWFASVRAVGGLGLRDRYAPGSLGFFLGLWVTMMAAMMFPSVWPAVSIHSLVMRRRARTGGRISGHSSAFVAGYLAAWTGFGLVAFGLLA